MGVPNSGFRLFGRIRIVLWLSIFTLHLLLWYLPPSYVPRKLGYGCACMLPIAMTLSPSFISHNQAVWARAAGTNWVKSAVDVTSCTIHVQTNYSYSFWRHYSSKYEYTIRYRSEYEANIRYIPSPNTLTPRHYKLSVSCTKQTWCNLPTSTVLLIAHALSWPGHPALFGPSEAVTSSGQQPKDVSLQLFIGSSAHQSSQEESKWIIK